MRTQLRRSLKSFEPPGTDVDRMLELIESEGDPFSSSHFHPGHFTASGFVLSPDGGSVVLIHHAKLGKWLQPGGHFEETDTSAEDAARREILEETGLNRLQLIGLHDLDIHLIPARADQPRHQHFDLRFAFQAVTTELVRTSEVLDIAWIPLGQVENWNAERSVARPVQSLIGLYSGSGS